MLLTAITPLLRDPPYRLAMPVITTGMARPAQAVDNTRLGQQVGSGGLDTGAGAAPEQVPGCHQKGKSTKPFVVLALPWLSTW